MQKAGVDSRVERVYNVIMAKRKTMFVGRTLVSEKGAQFIVLDEARPYFRGMGARLCLQVRDSAGQARWLSAEGPQKLIQGVGEVR